VEWPRGRDLSRYAGRVRVPAFLVGQFIVPGSLCNTPDGFRIQARNSMGDGVLVGIGAASVDGVAIEPSAITAIREGEGTVHRADAISRTSPIRFARGDVVTLRVAGLALNPGRHVFELELYELNLGLVSLGFEEALADDC
jgi:hypothetical protein